MESHPTGYSVLYSPTFNIDGLLIGKGPINLIRVGNEMTRGDIFRLNTFGDKGLMASLSSSI